MNCGFCGRDQGFVAYCEGCCLECGDTLARLDKPELIRQMAYAGIEIRRLLQSTGVRVEANPKPWSPPGDRIIVG